ncbi:phage tail protein, partial [Streptomyces sp. SB3404]|nr:phage tail protein [Streptomyces boncukensis]
MANTVNIIVGATNATGRGLAGVNQSINRLARTAAQADRDVGSLRANAVSLAPALLPIAAATAPIAAGLGAAAGAMLAFGAATVPQIKNLADAAKAETEYKDAVQKSGARSAEAVKAHRQLADQMARLPQPTREAAAGFMVLRDDFQEWSDSLASSTMPVFTKSFAAFRALLPKTSGLVRATSRELDRFVTIAAGGLATPGFDRFMARFEEFAGETLRRATDGVIRLARRLQSSSSGGGIRTFMEFAQENAPLVREALTNLSRALTNLLRAASQTGVGLLQVVNVLAKLVASVPSGLLTKLLQLYTAFRLLRLGAAGLAALSGGVASFTGAIIAMRAAAAGAATRTAALGAAWGALSRGARFGIIAGGLAAAALGIKKLADRARGAPPDINKLTTSLKELANTGRFTGELQKTFGDVDGLVKKIKQLGKETEKANKTALGFRIPGLDDAADKLAGAINDMAKGGESLNALKEDFKGLDEALAGLVKGGHADVAAQSFARIKRAAREQGVSMKELNALVPEYRAAMAELKANNELAARGMGLFGEQAIATKAKLESQKQSADGLRQAIQALNDAQRAGLGGMIGFEAAIDAATKAARQNAGALRMRRGELVLNSEKSRNAASALQDLAAKTDEAATTARESGRSWSHVNGIYDRGRKKLIQSAVQMGLTRAEAKKLAAQILKTPDKTARLKGNLEDLARKVKSAKRRIRSVPKSKRHTLRGLISDLERKLARAKRQIRSVPKSKRSSIRATIAQLQAQIRRAKNAIGSVRGKTVTIRTNYVISRKATKGATFGRGGSYWRAHGGIVGGMAHGGVRGGG